MPALLLVPALLGLALFIDEDTGGDDSDIVNSSEEDANDRAEGNDESNLIFTEGGNDFIQANGGADTIDGGAGNDTIYAGDGDDSVIGGEGDDVLAAFGIGNTPDAPDTLDGGSGEDVLFGDNGDILTGGDGADIFATIQPASVDTEAVTITDFEIEKDTLIVFVPEANDPAEEIELRYDSDENALRAFWRDEEVAVLNGLNDSDASNVDISIIDAADLQLAGFA
jgi:Ca2+-binding RTX toxin-like protein